MSAQTRSRHTIRRGLRTNRRSAAQKAGAILQRHPRSDQDPPSPMSTRRGFYGGGVPAGVGKSTRKRRSPSSHIEDSPPASLGTRSSVAGESVIAQRRSNEKASALVAPIRMRSANPAQALANVEPVAADVVIKVQNCSSAVPMRTVNGEPQQKRRRGRPRKSGQQSPIRTDSPGKEKEEAKSSVNAQAFRPRKLDCHKMLIVLNPVNVRKDFQDNSRLLEEVGYVASDDKDTSSSEPAENDEDLSQSESRRPVHRSSAAAVKLGKIPEGTDGLPELDVHTPSYREYASANPLSLDYIVPLTTDVGLARRVATTAHLYSQLWEQPDSYVHYVAPPLDAMDDYCEYDLDSDDEDFALAEGLVPPAPNCSVPGHERSWRPRFPDEIDWKRLLCGQETVEAKDEETAPPPAAAQEKEKSGRKSRNARKKLDFEEPSVPTADDLVPEDGGSAPHAGSVRAGSARRWLEWRSAFHSELNDFEKVMNRLEVEYLHVRLAEIRRQQKQEMLQSIIRDDAETGKELAEANGSSSSLDGIDDDVFDSSDPMGKDFEEDADGHVVVNPHNHTTSVDNRVCQVCHDGESYDDNLIVFCDGCDMAAHQHCYGVQKIPKGFFFCDRCRALGIAAPLVGEDATHCRRGEAIGHPEGIADRQLPSNILEGYRRLKCCFCHTLEGPMKRTTDGRWAHVLCALWLPGVVFSDPDRLDGITVTPQLHRDRWRLMCKLCGESGGACIQCKCRTCCYSMHVTCAAACPELFMRMVEDKGDTVQYVVYCPEHTKKLVPSAERARQVRGILPGTRGTPLGSPKVMERVSQVQGEQKVALKNVIDTRHKYEIKARPSRISVIFRHWREKRQRCRFALIPRFQYFLETHEKLSTSSIPGLTSPQRSVVVGVSETGDKLMSPVGTGHLSTGVSYSALAQEFRQMHECRYHFESARLVMDVLRRREKLKRSRVHVKNALVDRLLEAASSSSDSISPDTVTAMLATPKPPKSPVSPHLRVKFSARNNTVEAQALPGVVAGVAVKRKRGRPRKHPLPQ